MWDLPTLQTHVTCEQHHAGCQAQYYQDTNKRLGQYPTENGILNQKQVIGFSQTGTA